MRLILGDPRHDTAGRHSAFAPVGLGYLAEIAQKRVGADQLHISIHSDTAELIDTIRSDRPNIIALSNYCWNAELTKTVFRQAKAWDPRVINIAGGWEFPSELTECKEYLQYREEIDFYVFQEGEITFSNLVSLISRGQSTAELKSLSKQGVMNLHPDTGELIAGQPPDRLQDLDVIPSPYLSGLMDKFLHGSHMPFIESARGCPYSCTFCTAGAKSYNNIYGFSIERIKQEVDYITARMKGFPDVPLAIADSNFGMLKRDEELAEHIGSLQERYGWPRIFNVSTGKSQFSRIVRVAKKLNRGLTISISPQSMNPPTVKAIQRKNLGGDQMTKVYSDLKKHGINTYADLILPLPLETRESFVESIKELCNSNLQRPIPFTTMMLKGTPMSSKETRSRYGMVTKYRVLPRQFGTYNGIRCFEIEEVCIATNTMPFEDYLECRGFSFIFALFAHEQFDIFSRHATELEVEIFSFFYKLWEKIRQEKTALSEIYNCFISETKEELFASPDELYEFYQEEHNYRALLHGEIGDNLIRKYSTRVLVERSVESLRLGYATLVEMIDGSIIEPDAVAALKDAELWVRTQRDFARYLDLKMEESKPRLFEFEYDVEEWYRAEDGAVLQACRRPVKYRLTPNHDRIKSAVESAKAFHGADPSLWVSRLLQNTPLQDLWLDCQRIASS
jgi:radical SAM superfamily enzyme YgiQ (UPF0313 family)